MIAITLVRGEWYSRMADLTEPRIQEFTGLRVRRITLPDDSDPIREKLRMTEMVDEPFVYIDVDCIVLQRWHIDEPTRLSLTMGPTWPIDGERTRVYSTGVMLVPGGCRELFAEALRVYDRGDVGCYDEGPLTAAIRATGHDVDVLDRRFNRASSMVPSDDTVVWHIVGHHGSPRAKFAAVQVSIARLSAERSPAT